MRCVCVLLGARGWRGGEWMRGLGIGFTNPVLDVCLCFGCGGVGVGNVCGEWVGGRR